MTRHYFIATIISIFFFSISFGQKYNDCQIKGGLYVKVQQTPQFNGSLQEYFEKELSKKLKKFEGSIQLNILIDSSGKACCMNIKDNTSRMSSPDLKTIVDQMPTWKPAHQINRNVNYSVIILLNRFDSKFIVRYVNEN